MILGVSAQAEWPRVPIPMSWRGWPHAEGRRSHRAHSCPQLEPHHAMAARVAQPWEHGICATETQTQNGGKNPARLNFVPFNTRVITTSGNLPPTQLCARINWKSVITITNNSLLAFIASEA